MSERLDLLEVAVAEVLHDQVVALRPPGVIVRVEHRGDGHPHDVAAVGAAVVLVRERLQRGEQDVVHEGLRRVQIRSHRRLWDLDEPRKRP